MSQRPCSVFPAVLLHTGMVPPRPHPAAQISAAVNRKKADMRVVIVTPTQTIVQNPIIRHRLKACPLLFFSGNQQLRRIRQERSIKVATVTCLGRTI
jgi:hypothetical protein